MKSPKLLFGQYTIPVPCSRGDAVSVLPNSISDRPPASVMSFENACGRSDQQDHCYS
jgi:hypothetical protein